KRGSAARGAAQWGANVAAGAGKAQRKGRWRATAQLVREKTGCRKSVLRLGNNAEIGLQFRPALGVLGLGGLVGYGRHDDDVLALLPVHRRGDLMFGGQLQAVDDAQD